MPKVTINNTQGIKITAGSGLALGSQGVDIGSVPVGFYPTAAPEDIAAGNPGALSVSTYFSTVGSDAGGDTWTLADGVVKGQMKKILFVDATGTGLVSITSPVDADNNLITMTQVGDQALLEWNGSAWRILSVCNIAGGNITTPVIS